MAKKPKPIKIDGIEIKDHHTVSFTMTFIIAVICFAAGVLAYKYFFMILPQKSGCVQLMVKTTDGISVQGATVAIIFNMTGQTVASGSTDRNGRIIFCGYFMPNEEYAALILKENLSGIVVFRTNERSTADFPVIVKSERP